MEEDKRRRLKKLTEFRDSGVLSEGQYQIAKTRLLAADAADADDEYADPRPSLLASYWPALVGFGILIVMVVGVVIYGRMQAEQDMVDLNVTMSSDAVPNLLDTAPSGAEVCSSDATGAGLRDIIFERAQQQYGGDPGPLESLRKAVGMRMNYPQVRGLRPDVGRTDCGGRFVLDLPPSVHGAFDGLSALEADIGYAVQVDAQGNASVAEITGADQLIEQLAVAASVVGGPGKAPDDLVPKQAASRPSFDCRRALFNVERLICRDEGLSKLDRDLALRYESLRRDLSGADWQSVSDSQRNFLRRRTGCRDVACLHDLYVARMRYLDQVADAYEAR